jgi:hypothetical protein
MPVLYAMNSAICVRATPRLSTLRSPKTNPNLARCNALGVQQLLPSPSQPPHRNNPAFPPISAPRARNTIRHSSRNDPSSGEGMRRIRIAGRGTGDRGVMRWPGALSCGNG